ncbi:ribosome biogenesis protein BOP1 homolog [Papilio machaon]|uniref:ribosome biogenesis protein BOP1 homolog n=1 Tax=Papilio machaon TaxID=76193 RepID=UPI001E6658A5|nr:ribosome biogenesis protein BOP1 homolog [Papilio machaon]
MPPYKTGLLKRKISENTNKTEDNSSNSSCDDHNLITGDLDKEEDSSDSDNEDGVVPSDTELDGVVFDSGDSLLSDDAANESLEESSDVSDSEEDEASDGSNEESDSDKSESNTEGTNANTAKSKLKPDNEDSGAESGSGSALRPPRSPRSSRHNTNKKPFKKKEFKQTKTVADKNANSSVDALEQKIKEVQVNIQPVQEKDEYESGDTSDEEGRVNTAGEVPRWWYAEYDHVGYDADGRRIARPPHADRIDDFLRKCEDPDFWRTVRDPSTGQEIILSKKDLELISRIREGRVPNAEHDEYQPWVEWFSGEVLQTPLRAFPEHKRSFLPSRDEQRHVARLVHALRMGWAKTRRQLADERRRNKELKFYDLWGSGAQEEQPRALQRHIPAPRRPPPSHAESYNPPPEYLLDDKEMKEWNSLEETPWRRKYTFLPTQHSCLRAVPAYPRFLRERFLRCLDLYLAPRAIKMRLTIRPEELVPQLPAPRDLQPFPTDEVLQFRGHTGLVRSADFDPAGQYVVSGGDDATVRIWEAGTGRCLRTIELGEPVRLVEWTPVGGLTLVGAAAGRRLLLLNPGGHVGAHRAAHRTDLLLAEPPPAHDVRMDERTAGCVQWETVDAAQWARGVRVAIAHFKPVQHFSWHARGDYVVVTLEEGASRGVVVHQLSRRRSQLPFRRNAGRLQCAAFHPHRPLLFVVTQRAVRVYDLVKQELVRKLLAGAQWLSALALHPAGDNLLLASYDRKCIWFDLELSSRPYQTLRLHAGAVRSVAFHRRYPLFASAGDDRHVVVCHGCVYNDLLQNPLLVPLKQLRAPPPRDQLSVLQVRWHPAQPWLLAACADGTLRLYA